MHVLYGRPGSGSAVVEAILELAGVDYRLEVVPGGDGRFVTADAKRINPMGQVPTLAMPDGSLMTESAAIAMHLADCFPALGLAPAAASAAHGQYLRWMFFLAVNLYGSNMRIYYPERYTSDRASAAAVKEDALSRQVMEWDVYAAALGHGPFLLGAQMTAADLYACMLASWSLDLAGLFKRHANLAAMHRRVAAVPAIARAWARNEM
jgi:glutathione S-transferase